MISNNGGEVPTAIAPSPSPVPVAPVTKPAPSPKPTEPVITDGFREVVETIVFVIVLVMLLKTFVAEAFVIPTGSMAETLLGYQKFNTCPECGHRYPVNCSCEVDPPEDRKSDPVVGATCPNCRFRDIWRTNDKVLKASPAWHSGDRVLVSKFPYDNPIFGKPSRYDVVVFKYPKEPQKKWTSLNYIKRLIGLPGETIGIYKGDLYKCDEMIYENRRRPEDPLELWESEFMYAETHVVQPMDGGRIVVNGKTFEILQRPPSVMLEMKRLVYDNDHQPNDLNAKKFPPRWQASGVLQPIAIDKEALRVFRQSDDSPETSWIRYRHLLVTRQSDQTPDQATIVPQLIDNFMGYNAGDTRMVSLDQKQAANVPWVGDLLLAATVMVERPQGEVAFELSRSIDRFQARFDVAAGTCTLVRLQPGKKEVVLATQPCAVKKPGKYRVRFSNVDQRLTVWVDSALVFGDGKTYDAPAQPGPDEVNDKEPASIGVRGDGRFAISNIVLDRDTYYTQGSGGDVDDGRGGANATNRIVTRYVQPGHYFCLGDNSSQSSDGRDWGTVPERLMQGRAMLVYFPFWPINRVGPIR